MPVDYSKYPPNWLREIRPRILARAGATATTPARCETCGAPDREVGYHTADGTRFFSHQQIDDELHESGYDHFEHELAGVSSDKGPIRIVLTVSHLDHDEENWAVADDRLACLCQICHFRHDRKNNWQRRWHNTLTSRALARRQRSLFPSLIPEPADAATLPDHH